MSSPIFTMAYLNRQASSSTPSRIRMILVAAAFFGATLYFLRPHYDVATALASSHIQSPGPPSLVRFQRTFPQPDFAHQPQRVAQSPTHTGTGSPTSGLTPDSGAQQQETLKIGTAQRTTTTESENGATTAAAVHAKPNYYVERLRDGRAEFDWATTSKMFVFGDSFSSIAKKRYAKRGVDDGRHKHLIGRTTGLKWCDYLYTTFKNPVETQYWNFAQDGATIDLSLVPPRLEESGSFDEQVFEFKSLFSPTPGPEQVNWHSNNSLFMIMLGINDVREMARREFSPPALQRTATALPEALFSRATDLYDLGARNFLFFNLAALADAPKYSLESGIGHNVSSWLKAGTAFYNGALPDSVARFEARHPDANVMMFDWESLYGLISNMPEVFGITDCTRFEMSVGGKREDQGRMGLCYQDPSHPTWVVMHTLAQSVNGFLHRHSRSFWMSEKQDGAMVA